MNKLFALQLIVSFLVGGGIITLISLLAEKANARVSGIILAFPSTVALGFFFLAWTASTEAVAKVVPATIIPLGLAVLFPVIYVFVAEKIHSFITQRVPQIAISFVICTISWLIFALPFALFKFSSLLFGLLGYTILIVLANYLLHRKNVEKPVALTYSFAQKVGRAVFVGCVITLITYISKTVNPFWGGVFSAFPAAYSSMLMLLHWYYGPEKLLPVVRKVPIGSISIVTYALIAMIVFPTFGFILGTLIAYVASLIISVMITKLSR